jgi:hypothetical protein
MGDAGYIRFLVADPLGTCLEAGRLAAACDPRPDRPADPPDHTLTGEPICSDFALKTAGTTLGDVVPNRRNIGYSETVFQHGL